MARTVNTAQFIAQRFLRSPKSHSIINVMSWVSVVAVGVPVAAMVILMSVFNGFDAIVRGMHSDFEPEITLQPVRGAVMTADEQLKQRVEECDGVRSASWVLDGEALVSFRGRQTTATVRGVDEGFARVVAIDDMMTSGDYALEDAWGDCAVLGRGLAYQLGVRGALADSVRMFVPSRGRYSKLMPTSGVNSAGARLAGIFALDADTDGEYAIVGLQQAQQLMDYPEGASALMVRVTSQADVEGVRAAIAAVVPEGVAVRTRTELNSAMYKVLDYEKLAVLLIGVMILVVASFSVVGTLTMLIIDKKESIATLRALGADTRLVRRIFVRQGMSICMLGALGGFALGLVVSLVQQHFGVIRIPAETFLVEAYPVRVVPADLMIVVAAFTVVGYVATCLTVAGRIKNIK